MEEMEERHQVRLFLFRGRCRYRQIFMPQLLKGERVCFFGCAMGAWEGREGAEERCALPGLWRIMKMCEGVRAQATRHQMFMSEVPLHYAALRQLPWNI